MQTFPNYKACVQVRADAGLPIALIIMSIGSLQHENEPFQKLSRNRGYGPRIRTFGADIFDLGIWEIPDLHRFCFGSKAIFTMKESD